MTTRPCAVVADATPLIFATSTIALPSKRSWLEVAEHHHLTRVPGVGPHADVRVIVLRYLRSKRAGNEHGAVL